jgi:hypothetical protein
VAEFEHTDGIDQTGGERQQKQAGDRQSLRDRGEDGHGLRSAASYSCGVRSSDVTVDMRVINHFASRRSNVSRYDR